MALVEIGAKLTLKDGLRFRREAEKAAGGLGKMANESERAHRGLSRLSKIAIGAGIAGGIGLAVVELRKFAKGSTSAFKSTVGDAMRLQRVLGGTLEQTSALAYGASQSGVDIDTLGKSFGIFAKNLGAEGPVMTSIAKAQDKLNEARAESIPKAKSAAAQAKALAKHQDKLARLTSALAAAQDKLGVQVVDSNGKTRDQMSVLQDVAEQFKTMPNGPNKTAMAMRLFGRAGAALIPLLNKGKKGFKDFQVEAQRLGVLISNKDAKSVKEYTKAQRTLQASTKALKVSFGRELFPIMVEWEQSLVKVMPKVRDYARIALPALHDAVQGLVKGFEEGTGWGGRVKKALDGVVTTADTLGRILKDDVVPVVKWFADHPDAFKTAAVGVGAYKVAMMGAAFYTKSLAIWAPRAAVGVGQTATAGATASAASGGIGLMLAAVVALDYAFAKLLAHMDQTKEAQRNLIAGSPTVTTKVPSAPLSDRNSNGNSLYVGGKPVTKPPAVVTVPEHGGGTVVTGKALIRGSAYRGPVAGGDGAVAAASIHVETHFHGYTGSPQDAQRVAGMVRQAVQDKVARR